MTARDRVSFARDPKSQPVCMASEGCTARAVWECMACGERFCEDCVAAPQLGAEHANGRCLEPKPPGGASGGGVVGILLLVIVLAAGAGLWTADRVSSSTPDGPAREAPGALEDSAG